MLMLCYTVLSCAVLCYTAPFANADAVLCCVVWLVFGIADALLLLQLVPHLGLPGCIARLPCLVCMACHMSFTMWFEQFWLKALYCYICCYDDAVGMKSETAVTFNPKQSLQSAACV